MRQNLDTVPFTYVVSNQETRKEGTMNQQNYDQFIGVNRMAVVLALLSILTMIATGGVIYLIAQYV